MLCAAFIMFAPGLFPEVDPALGGEIAEDGEDGCILFQCLRIDLVEGVIIRVVIVEILHAVGAEINRGHAGLAEQAEVRLALGVVFRAQRHTKRRQKMRQFTDMVKGGGANTGHHFINKTNTEIPLTRMVRFGRSGRLAI